MTQTVNPKQQMAEFAVHQQRLAEDTLRARLTHLSEADRKFLNELIEGFRPSTLTADEVSAMWTKIRMHEQSLTDWLIDTTTVIQLELGGRASLRDYIDHVASAFSVCSSEDTVIDKDVLDWLVGEDELKKLINSNPWLLPLIATVTLSQMLIAEKK